MKKSEPFPLQITSNVEEGGLKSVYSVAVYCVVRTLKVSSTAMWPHTGKNSFHRHTSVSDFDDDHSYGEVSWNTFLNRYFKLFLLAACVGLGYHHRKWFVLFIDKCRHLNIYNNETLMSRTHSDRTC